MLADTPILVVAGHGRHRAAVRRAEGQLWMAHWLADRPDRVAGTQLEGLRPAKIVLPTHTAVGGALAGSAESVSVRGDDDAWHPARIAQGAWVAFVPRSLESSGIPPVRFVDAAGMIVSRAEPEALAAAEPLERQHRELLARCDSGGGVCPVCGETDWVAAPAPQHGPPAQVIFCRTCGHGDGGVTACFAPLT